MLTNLKFWLGFLKVVLSLAENIAGILRTKQAMTAGQKIEIGRQLAEVIRRAGVSDQVRLEISAMSDDALNDELRGD